MSADAASGFWLRPVLSHAEDFFERRLASTHEGKAILEDRRFSPQMRDTSGADKRTDRSDILRSPQIRLLPLKGLLTIS